MSYTVRASQPRRAPFPSPCGRGCVLDSVALEAGEGLGSSEGSPARLAHRLGSPGVAGGHQMCRATLGRPSPFSVGRPLPGAPSSPSWRGWFNPCLGWEGASAGGNGLYWTPSAGFHGCLRSYRLPKKLSYRRREKSRKEDRNMFPCPHNCE